MRTARVAEQLKRAQLVHAAAQRLADNDIAPRGAEIRWTIDRLPLKKRKVKR